MLRKLLLSTAIAAVSFNFAIANQDNPVFVDEARFDWSGAYWGVQGGWAGADHSVIELTPIFSSLGPQGDQNASGIGGVFTPVIESRTETWYSVSKGI